MRRALAMNVIPYIKVVTLEKFVGLQLVRLITTDKGTDDVD